MNEDQEFVIKVSDPNFAYFIEYALEQLGIESTEAGFNMITGERELFYAPFNIPASCLPPNYHEME